MSTTAQDARSILEGANYRTLFPKPDAKSFYFEDSTVLGVLYVVESVAALIDDWEQLQDTFLRSNAHRLAVSPHKAWNCYTVLLTTQAPGKVESGQLFNIEENFRATRKIARGGLKSRSDIEVAIAPLLPLRRLLSLHSDDVKSTLMTRLGGSGNPISGVLKDLDPKQIANSVIASI